MIPTWFDSPERVARLCLVARELEGTPFCANSEAPGRTGGMDCVRLLHYINVRLGVLPAPLTIPPQAMDAGEHSERSALLEAFETWPGLRTRFARLPSHAPATLLPGDILCFQSGLAPHHGAVLLPGAEIFHTLRPIGAHRLRLNAAVRGWRIVGSLVAAFRPLP